MYTTASSPDGVQRAVTALRSGGLVALPTETVYGLGADARNADAVRRVFTTKGRPADHPLIVHLGSSHDLLSDSDTGHGWARDIPDTAVALATAYWPGPLTMLLRRHPSVLDVVTGARDTVGLRVPAHPVALAVLRAFGGGVAAPSANRFGAVSPTSAAHVLADIGHLLDPVRDVVLDGGSCPVGIESTIVDFTVDPPVILRPGGLAVEAIESVLGFAVTHVTTGPSRAPGMLVAHYAPRAEVVLADDEPAAEAWMASLLAAGRHVEMFPVVTDVDELARTLYSSLRAADERGLDAIVVVLPGRDGIGAAIVDRLLRAATGSRRTLGPSEGPSEKLRQEHAEGPRNRNLFRRNSRTGTDGITRGPAREQPTQVRLRAR